ncbi:TRPT1 [Branchiostoma lanceolatum]|uniref:2'-phosphotransferase n=1 Tax=Branchiostoma lanceolatum TaxID=7740 RepID=A0A8J9ZSV6_BRALA|nr:TRPT1 [Branchiostoma lanceolatum]
MGFQLDLGGFLYVDEILRHQQFKRYTKEDVRQVVADNDKKRFALQEEEETGRLQIRANQGHTLEVEELELTPISDPAEAPTVVHGTYLNCWDKIRTQGLSRMKRNHIHFAPGEPGEDGVISGMRKTCQVLVFIDIAAAMRDGLQFYRSANNVILCPGDREGLILPKYFQQALQARPSEWCCVSTLEDQTLYSARSPGTACTPKLYHSHYPAGPHDPLRPHYPLSTFGKKGMGAWWIVGASRIVGGGEFFHWTFLCHDKIEQKPYPRKSYCNADFSLVKVQVLLNPDGASQ